MEQNTKKTKKNQTLSEDNVISKLGENVDEIKKLLELIYHELIKNKSPFEK